MIPGFLGKIGVRISGGANGRSAGRGRVERAIGWRRAGVQTEHFK